MPKSTKAVKITDKNKAWNKKPKPSSYRLDSIPINKVILIVCEGQTEKCYFEAFPVLGIEIKCIDLKGQSKLKLIESTEAIIEYSDKEFDEIWCVFDMDVKRGADEFADFDNAIYKTLELGYKAAYSNDAFELWFYLHYNLTKSQHLRTFYYKELSKRFGINYAKDGKKRCFCEQIYSILNQDSNSSQQNAIKRAKSLFEEQKNLTYHEQNPVTKVYELVETLNKNLRR
ncbi:MAG TPA: RloB family protein [Bacteroidales bacterium]|nr:RloB family protein [Bacteroidales bacterium]HOR60584.1 RloB family protein [Bacteroidales bacterium]HPL03862.1 RloB family protein [Bacteroidales bacterium]